MRWPDRLSYAFGALFITIVSPLVDSRRRARTILVANARTIATLPSYLRSIPHPVLTENGVDLSVFSTDSDTDRDQANGPRFVYVGALIEWKGVHFLLKAFSALAVDLRASLDIVGGGDMRPDLENQARDLGIADRVRFHGHLGHQDVQAIVKDARALVLPSMKESGGAVMLEAMALRVPVISTAWGGALDYLDESCGILVKPDSVDGFIGGLTRAMNRLGEDASLAREMGDKGRQRVVENYDWERKVDRMIEIYRSALATRQ